ncbi:MAG: hypothetical protein AAGE52_09790 [Myxococcota bacterium]
MEESLFTPALRELWASEPAILAAVFVDHEGETIDYCASMDVYDARIAGAHLLVVIDQIREFTLRVGAGRPSTLELKGKERDFVVRLIGEGTALVVVVQGGRTDQSLLVGVDDTVDRLREEAGIAAPNWDPVGPNLEVSIRRATGWPFAPKAFVEGGKRQVIADVLGRWEETGALAGNLVCFRVRTENGDELTLAYDESEGFWMRW